MTFMEDHVYNAPSSGTRPPFAFSNETNQSTDIRHLSLLAHRGAGHRRHGAHQSGRRVRTQRRVRLREVVSLVTHLGFLSMHQEPPHAAHGDLQGDFCR